MLFFVCCVMNKLFLLFGLLFFLPFVSASPDLFVSEQSFLLNQTVGTVVSYPVVFSNVGDVPLFNLSFSSLDGFVFPELPVLLVNDSFSSVFVYESVPGRSGVFSSVLSFDYFSLLNVSPVGVVVNVSSSELLFSSGEFVVGSSLVFVNVDSVPLVVRCIPLNLSVSLQPGEVFDFVVSSDGTFLFFEELFGASDSVIVLSSESEVLVHNSLFDVPFVFDIVPLSQESDLLVDVLIGGFELSVDGFVQGVVRVTNIGSYDVVGARVFGVDGWISEQSFSLFVGASELLLFNVSVPSFVGETFETNRTYEVDLFVGGGNVPVFSDVLFVKVLFHDFDSFVDVDGNIIRVTYLSVNDTLSYCRSRPDDVQCASLVRVVNRTVVQTLFENVSLPSDVVKSLNDNLVSLVGGMDRNTNSLREVRTGLSSVEGELGNVSFVVSSYMFKVDKMERDLLSDARSSKIRAIIFWVVSIVVVVVGIAFFLFRRNNELLGNLGLVKQ